MGGCRQSIDGDKTESRRTVKNDVVIDAVIRIKKDFKNPFPVKHHLKLQVNTCHIETAWNNIEVSPDRIDWKVGLFSYRMVYNAGWNVLHEMTGKVCLGIEIHEQNLFAS